MSEKAGCNKNEECCQESDRKVPKEKAKATYKEKRQIDREPYQPGGFGLGVEPVESMRG